MWDRKGYGRTWGRRRVVEYFTTKDAPEKEEPKSDPKGKGKVVDRGPDPQGGDGIRKMWEKFYTSRLEQFATMDYDALYLGYNLTTSGAICNQVLTTLCSHTLVQYVS